MTTRLIKVQFNYKGQKGFSQQKCKGMWTHINGRA